MYLQLKLNYRRAPYNWKFQTRIAEIPESVGVRRKVKVYKQTVAISPIRQTTDSGPCSDSSLHIPTRFIGQIYNKNNHTSDTLQKDKQEIDNS